MASNPQTSIDLVVRQWFHVVFTQKLNPKQVRKMQK